jgi:predicted nucleotidyltransferase/DNA-binding HxlR family transcriptional regulator
MYDEYSYRILMRLREVKAARFKDLRLIVGNPRMLTLKLRKLMGLGLVDLVDGLYVLTSRGVEVSRILEDLDKALRGREFKVRNLERIPHYHYVPVIRRYCELLFEFFGDRLVSIMLFGSVARGDWDANSDIDILIIADGWEGKPIWDRVREVGRVKARLSESLEYLDALKAGYHPIIQNYTLSVEEAKRFNRVYLDALIDGIILYDRDEFLSGILQSLRRRLEDLGSMRITLPNGRFYWVLKRDFKVGEVITFG